MKKLAFINVLLVVFLLIGCGKESNPTATDDLTGTSTVITGTVKDSLGNPIDSAAIKIKYYFTAATKHGVKADPCSLVSFTASRIANGVQLNWATEGENSAYQWEIERSVLSDTGFVLIGRLDASGTVSAPVNYSYIDSTAAADSADYYRLCLMDIDGTHYYYDPVGLGPVPIYHDSYSTARPCPFNGNTSISYSLACSSHVALVIKNNGQVIKTLVSQNQTAGLNMVSWNGTDDGSTLLTPGYFLSDITISRHDSTLRYSKPVFINIVDSASSRVNSYSDAQGSFTISDLPIDSVFNMTDAMGTDLGNVRVCDSVTIYAVKGGFTVKKITMVLGKNTISTINFVLR